MAQLRCYVFISPLEAANLSTPIISACKQWTTSFKLYFLTLNLLLEKFTEDFCSAEGQSCILQQGSENPAATALWEPRMCRNERALEDECEQTMLITLTEKLGFAASPVNVILQALQGNSK